MLSEARNRTRILVDTSQLLNPLSHNGHSHGVSLTSLGSFLAWVGSVSARQTHEGWALVREVAHMLPSVPERSSRGPRTPETTSGLSLDAAWRLQAWEGMTSWGQASGLEGALRAASQRPGQATFSCGKNTELSVRRPQLKGWHLQLQTSDRPRPHKPSVSSHTQRGRPVG